MSHTYEMNSCTLCGKVPEIFTDSGCALVQCPGCFMSTGLQEGDDDEDNRVVYDRAVAASNRMNPVSPEAEA
jgi:hypothetical protein